ncbi:MAG: hypothetical protein J6M39_08200 [Lachnospiraceae bacterium]|nr:hypothetical protein [Lachnospiraceae bacterium]
MLTISSTFIFIGCGNQKKSEVTADNINEEESSEDDSTVQELNSDELDALTTEFNTEFNMLVLKRPFNSFDEIRTDVEHCDVEPIGEYKCVSGSRTGNEYTVHVEVVEADNDNEVVFPPRDVTFTKEGDEYTFISNIFDWTSGADENLTLETEFKQFDGKTYIYTYQTVEDRPNSYVYVINNGKRVPGGNIAVFNYVNEIQNNITSVIDITPTDYNNDGYTDLIITGTDANGVKHICAEEYSSVAFGPDAEKSTELEANLSNSTSEDAQSSADSDSIETVTYSREESREEDGKTVVNSLGYNFYSDNTGEYYDLGGQGIVEFEWDDDTIIFSDKKYKYMIEGNVLKVREDSGWIEYVKE